jgi:hypothetical protein
MTAILTALILAANPHLPAQEMAAHLVLIEQHGGPPAHVMFGVIMVETGDSWNTKTRGRAGEVGLCQIHPCHGALYRQARRGWTANMDMGALILTACRKKHPDSWQAALADYNGGPRGHRKWQCQRYAARALSRARPVWVATAKGE